jgi:hypothetical protein
VLADPVGGGVAVLSGARSARALRWLAIPALALLAGCYTYEPLATVAPPAPGDQVRVRYSTDGPELVPWQRSIGRTATLQGRVIAWNADAGTLAVFAPPAAGMSRASPHPDTVAIPTARITLTERREFSRGRTTAFAVGSGLAGAIVVRALTNWTRSARQPPSDDT